MENEQNKLVLLAEDVMISEESKLNPVFLTIEVKLCDDQLNANRQGVTGRFIADVVNRSSDYNCLPFYADTKNLLAQNYEALGHLYNRATRTFGTSMIGSMTEFYSDVDRDGVMSLYGKIKIPKREKDICLRVIDLYEMGHFAVSFEVIYDARECIVKNGGQFIDASENSSLTGLCLVWKPACESAYALDLVAERSDNAEIVAESEEPTSERGEMEMKDAENMNAEVTEELVEEEKTDAVAEVAEAETVSEEPATEETTVAEETQEEPVQEEAVAESKDGDEDDKSETSCGEEEKEDTVAETQETQAEVIENSYDVREEVFKCPETGETVHVVETRERYVETLEDANRVIAELKDRIAELEQVEAKYNAIVAEEQARILAEKQAKAKAFAEKQGLNVNDTAVAEAIEKLDYQKIAELSMAEEQEEEKEEPVPKITLASFVELETSSDEYGGLLKPAKK